jgi:hypothetical protein
MRDATLLDGDDRKVEAALAELVAETLVLLDGLLVESPEIGERVAGALPRRTGDDPAEGL